MEMLEWVLVGVCAIDFVLHLLAIAVIKYEKGRCRNTLMLTRLSDGRERGTAKIATSAKV